MINLRRLAPCLVAIAIDAMGFGLVYPIMSAMLADPGAGLISANASQSIRYLIVALAFAIYPLTMFFGSSFMGDLSDLFGRRKILSICVFGLGAGYALMFVGVVLSSVIIVLVGRAFTGLMAGCQGIAQAAVVDASTPETKAINMSRMSIAFSVGIVVGPLLGGVTSDSRIVPIFNYGTPFLIVAIVSVLCAVWIALELNIDMASHTGHQRSIGWSTPFKIIAEGARERSLIGLLVSFFFMQIGYSLYFQIIQLRLKDDLGYGSLELGVFSGVIGICFVIGLSAVVPWALRRWSVPATAAIGLATGGVAQIATSVLHAAVAVWILAIIIGIFDMVSYTTLLTASSDAVDDTRQGWALGLLGSTMAVAWVITGLMAYLSPVVGNSVLICIGGVFWLVSLAVLKLSSGVRLSRGRKIAANS